MSNALVKRKPIDPSLTLEDLREEHFCELYASDKEFCGNGNASYVEAFNVDLTEKGAYNNASVKALYLLKKPHILARINFFLDLGGFNDSNADKQLNFVMMQNADLRAKMAAIKEYNALKGRVKQKLEFSFQQLNDAELEAEKRKLEQEIAQAEAATSDGMPTQAGAHGVPDATIID